MKTKMYDWVLRLTRIIENSKRVIMYVNYFDTTTEKIAAIANDYHKRYEVVRVYKFQIAI